MEEENNKVNFTDNADLVNDQPVQLPQPQQPPSQPVSPQSQVIGPQLQPNYSETQTSDKPQVQQATSPPPVINNQPRKSGFKKVLLPVIVGAFLLIGGAAAAYNIVVLNSPEKIWEKALSNTSDGLESLVELASEETAKGGSIDGSFKFSSPLAADGTISGIWYEDTSQYTFDVGVAGIRPKGEIRILPAGEGLSPDIYIKLEDVNSIGSLLGAGNPLIDQAIQSIDGSWFSIDHTLYEQALNSAGSSSSLQLSSEDLTKIGENLSGVLKEYLFTVDESKAAVIVQEAIGEEDFEGDSTYKYIVRIQKEQFKNLISEAIKSLEDTKLKEIVATQDGQSLEEALNLEGLLNDIEKIDFADATAEAWVNLDTKLIRNIRITPGNSNSDEIGYIDFGLPYDGGDEIPLSLGVVYGNKDESVSFKATLGFNKETKGVKASFSISGKMQGEDIIAEGSLTSTPSNEQINIEKPTDSKNIYELLGLIYGGYSQALPNDDLEIYDGTNLLESGTLGESDIRQLPFIGELLEL